MVASLRESKEMKARVESSMSDQRDLEVDLRGVQESVAKLKGKKEKNSNLARDLSECSDKLTTLKEKLWEETDRLVKLGITRFWNFQEQITVLNPWVEMRLEEIHPGREINTDGT